MGISLPLDKMTSKDKVAMMEQLWDALCEDPQSVSSPAWHQKVLDQREKDIRQGKAGFISFEQAKDRIRKQAK